MSERKLLNELRQLLNKHEKSPEGVRPLKVKSDQLWRLQYDTCQSILLVLGTCNRQEGKRGLVHKWTWLVCMGREGNLRISDNAEKMINDDDMEYVGTLDEYLDFERLREFDLKENKS